MLREDVSWQQEWPAIAICMCSFLDKKGILHRLCRLWVQATEEQQKMSCNTKLSSRWKQIAVLMIWWWNPQTNKHLSEAPNASVMRGDRYIHSTGELVTWEKDPTRKDKENTTQQSSCSISCYISALGSIASPVSVQICNPQHKPHSIISLRREKMFQQ